MMILYDEQEVIRSYIECEVYAATQKAKQKERQEGREEGREEGRQEGKTETAKRLLKMGKFSLEEIADGTGLSIEEIKKLAE